MTEAEKDALLDAVRTFVNDEVLPAAQAAGDSTAFPENVVNGMRKLGLFGTFVPAEFGGLGLDMQTHAKVMEEIARGWISMAGVLNPHHLCCKLMMQSGSREQKESLLPRMASGEYRCAFSLTEPHTGSDVQAITTSASRAEDGSWVLTGRKRWITNGLAARFIFALVKTDPDAKPAHRGMTCFIIEKEPWAMTGNGRFAGVAIGENIDKMGDRGVETTDLVLDGYRCSGDRILGAEAEGLGKGFTQMIAAMETGRVGASALCVGVAQRCFEVAVDYARKRHTFGKPIAEHQAVQFKLAEMATSIRAARLLTQDAARMKDEGRRADLEAGMAKLFATETARKVAQDSFDIHGANGYAKDHEIERLLRDALSLVSAEGPAEIQKLIIGRAVTA
ncbi:MAG: acyl-CoA dehydrogenase family protein [Rhodobiaceae bacterium]|nr:acyl-CoA dehydrogenase family protein [Rhodobiaceae bacterium]